MMQRRDFHVRENYSSTICFMLAEAIWELQEKAKNKIGVSYVVWNRDSKQLKVDIDDKLDPNYLIPALFEHSVFHQSLHKFIENNRGRPLFHLDFHGKKDRKTNSDIDLGTKALLEFFHEEDQKKLV